MIEPVPAAASALLVNRAHCPVREDPARIGREITRAYDRRARES